MKRSATSNKSKTVLAAFSLVLTTVAPGAIPYDPEIVKYVDNALDHIEENSMMRNIVSWPEFREITFERAAELNDYSDAHGAIADALTRLGDRHSKLFLPDEAAAIANDDGSSDLLPPWTPVEGKLIGKDIGMITVPAFVGRHEKRMSRYVDEMHDAIENIDSDNICAWIVDLRDSTGRNVGPMLAGIGPILGSGEVFGVFRVNGTRRIFNIEGGRFGSTGPSARPYKLKNRNPPVAVLIGRITAGSGEATALSFVGRDMAVTIGEATAGKASGGPFFFLEDGAVLFVAASVMTDRIGRPYDGRVQPQIRASSEEIMGVAVDMLSDTERCQ